MQKGAITLKSQIEPLSSWTKAAATRLLSTARASAAGRGNRRPPSPAGRGNGRPPAPAPDGLGNRRPPAAALAATPSGSESAETGQRSDSMPLYRRLSALGGAQEGAVTRALNKWVREGRPVREVDLMKYVKDLRQYKRYKHALEVTDWMIKVKGMNMSYTNHAIRLDLVSKVKGLAAAEEYFSSLPEPAKNQRTYGAMLNCYCSEKMEEEAMALFKKMKELKISTSTLAYNNIMALHMKLGHPEKVHIQFEEMKAENVSPDNFTCCILMNSYASLNDIDSVESVIQEFEEGDEVTLQWSAYSTLAAIYTSANHFGKAEGALKKLEGLLDSHNREPFHFLISLYAGIGNLKGVNRVWKSLKTTFKKLTNMSYLVMLQALNKLDDINGMEKCFDEWGSVCASYDLRLANVMMGAFLRNGKIKEAESLRETATEKAGRFDFRTYELFLDYYLKNREMDEALKLVTSATSMAKQEAWKLSKDNVKSFFEHFEKSKDVDGAEKFCKSLKKLNCLDADAYKLLMRTYVAAGKTEPLLRQRMQDAKIEIGPQAKRLLGRVCKEE